jgi:peptidyl-tRNA hydrolase, PTH1 family
VWVVVGLGNPGKRYAATRHNVGFRVIDRLAASWAVEVRREVHRSRVGEARRGDERVLLVKPQTYMNDSGDAVASLRRFYRFEADRLVAIHDDVDLAVGRVRIRKGGSGGGNRGIASMIVMLDEPGFIRVKVGIGRPPAGRVPADYVLGVPDGPEASRLEHAEAGAADAVEQVLAHGVEHAMNHINQRETDHGGPPL